MGQRASHCADWPNRFITSRKVLGKEIQKFDRDLAMCGITITHYNTEYELCCIEFWSVYFQSNILLLRTLRVKLRSR